VFIISSTDFYIALSAKIFKAEIKEFEAILFDAEVNKFDKLHTLSTP